MRAGSIPATGPGLGAGAGAGTAKQHFLNFFLLPHGQGAFRPTCFALTKSIIPF